MATTPQRKSAILAAAAVLASVATLSLWQSATDAEPRRSAPYQACERAIAASSAVKPDFGIHRHTQLRTDHGDWLISGQYSTRDSAMTTYQCVATPDVPGEYRVSWWRED